mmetsp:Transcript_12885/g.36289  ORF Transcript_12885/g.36289 Transcript_12885/m.36289 type:complete len:112 (-) Transcript_12885:157-492(-)
MISAGERLEESIAASLARGADAKLLWLALSCTHTRALTAKYMAKQSLGAHHFLFSGGSVTPQEQGCPLGPERVGHRCAPVLLSTRPCASLWPGSHFTSLACESVASGTNAR